MYSQRLKLLRKEKGLTIKELGNQLGLHPNTYGAYEKKNRKPSINTLIKLAKFHDTSADYILGLSDNPSSNKNDNELKIKLDLPNLMWDGTPIEQEEIAPIKQLLEVIAIYKKG